MIRVVVDTNIYVSAIIFGETSEAVLTLTHAGVVDLFISPAIQKELRSVLRHTFRWTAPQVREALAEVNAVASLVKPSVRLSGILAHDQDHRILECALVAQAQFLITGDKKHLQHLKTFRGIRIVSPREFLDFLR